MASGKVVTLVYEGKSFVVKLYASLHPVSVNAQLGIPPQKVIYTKIRALLDVETNRIVKLKQHSEYPYYYYIDPMKVKEGGTYEVFFRDYSKITRAVFDYSSLTVLKRKFEDISTANNMLSYNDYINFLNLKKRKYKLHVKKHMDSYFEKSDALEKIHLKRTRIQDVAQASIEKGEDAIDEIIRLSFEAMDVNGNGAVEFEEFCDHWSKLYVMMMDVAIVSRKNVSSSGSSTASTPLTPFLFSDSTSVSNKREPFFRFNS